MEQSLKENVELTASYKLELLKSVNDKDIEIAKRNKEVAILNQKES